MLQGVSLKQLKADISRNLDITQGPVLVLQKVDPKTTYHVVKPVSQWPDTAQAWETVQHWAWVSFFRQETVSQLTAPQTSTHLPRSTYDGEEPKHPPAGAPSLSKPTPESLGSASPENEPEALTWLLYSVLAHGHPCVLEPQIQVLTVPARTKGHTFFTLRQLVLSRLSGNAPTSTLPGIWDQGKWKRKSHTPWGGL